MTIKKNIVAVSCFVLATLLIAAALVFLYKEEKSSHESAEKQKQNEQVSAVKGSEQKEDTKKCNLYAETPYDLPLISIAEISSFPQNIKDKADEILEKAQGFYYIKADKHNNSVDIILQNPVTDSNTYPRHQLEFVNINAKGEATYKTAGYAGIDGETSSAFEENGDLWVFDETIEPFRPIQHIVYDDNGKIKFAERWNYGNDEEIKYEMRNNEGRLVSVRKEITEGDQYRIEHIFYDNHGNTTGSMVVNYDGANISRFTYYDASSNDGVIILSEYSNGDKVREIVYNKDYELLNTVTAEYKNGIRSEIKVLNSDSKPILSISG